MQVHEKVKQYLEQNGIKQNFIASKIGMKQQIFSMMLNGQRRMWADDLEKICQELDVSADLFLRDKN